MRDEMSDNLYLIYIDESYDETHFAYSAIFINAFHWNDYFKDVVHWRGDWLERYGIAVDYELHATDLSVVGASSLKTGLKRFGQTYFMSLSVS